MDGMLKMLKMQERDMRRRVRESVSGVYPGPHLTAEIYSVCLSHDKQTDTETAPTYLPTSPPRARITSTSTASLHRELSSLARLLDTPHPSIHQTQTACPLSPKRVDARREAHARDEKQKIFLTNGFLDQISWTSVSVAGLGTS
jgi:hypothetical protein